jgi:hypothetical protein
MELTTSWKEEGIKLGIQQGIQLGLQQVSHQTETTILKRLLTRRFKDIPVDVVARIEQADHEQLLQWIENTIDAPTIDDVFKES